MTILERLQEYLNDDDNKYYGYELSSDEAKEIVEALQKQIPSYVVPTIDDEFGEEEVYYHCKQCGVMFYTWMNRYRRTNYCGYCGQKVMEG